MLWMPGFKNTKYSHENISAFSLWFLNKLPTMNTLMQSWCLNPESEFSDHLLWEVLSASRRADMYPQYMTATGHHLGEGDWVGVGRPEKRDVDHVETAKGWGSFCLAETEADASFWRDAWCEVEERRMTGKIYLMTEFQDDSPSLPWQGRPRLWTYAQQSIKWGGKLQKKGIPIKI